MQAEWSKSRPNRRDNAGFLSTLVFWWTVKLFREGYSHDITPDDVWDPRNKDRSQLLGDALEREWYREEERAAEKNKEQTNTTKPEEHGDAAARKHKPSLFRAIFKVFGFEYMLLGLLTLSWNMSRLVQPLLLGGLLAYLTPGSDIPRSHAFAYAGGVVALATLGGICNTHYVFGAHGIGIRARAACCALIYRKALRLSQGSLARTAAGKMVNLLSNDVSRLQYVSMVMNHMWPTPIVAVWCAYFMYDALGWPALVGITVVFIFTPLQAYTGRLVAKFRHQTALKTDERVRLMDEIISGIQVIKMYAWEKPFAKLVAIARRLELRIVRRTCLLRGFHIGLGLCTTRVALAIALVSAALAGEELYAAPIFVALSYFNVLAQASNVVFVRGVSEIAEAFISIRRLQDFMWLEEQEGSQLLVPSPEVNGERTEHKNALVEAESGRLKPIVKMEKVTARWNPESSEPTLSAIDLSVLHGKLVIVIGHVGSGKSSLLLSLLGELPAAEGSVIVHGRAAFASQLPWVFASTVRHNILLGRPLEKRRYKRVLSACALEPDLRQLPHGELTSLGQHALSGGQRARVGLARAVYTEVPIYLLDDPLSAVDAHVGKHLFEECICKFLEGKTRILATHQLQYLKYADHIVIMNNGRIEMQGDFPTLARIAAFDELQGFGGGDESDGNSNTEDDVEVKGQDTQKDPSSIRKLLRQISTMSQVSTEEGEKQITSQEKDVKQDVEASGTALEHSSKGRIQGKSVYVEYGRAGGSTCAAISVLMLVILTQVGVSSFDWFLSYWMIQEDIRRELLSPIEEGLNASLSEDWTTESYTTIIPQTQNNVSDASSKTQNNFSSTMFPEEPLLSTIDFSFVMFGFSMALLALALVRSLSFYGLGVRCSERLHAAMFTSVVRSRMRFFDINPTGRILNRFSKDIGSADEMLPRSMMDAGQVILQVVGLIAVTISVNFYFAVPVVLLGFLFWLDRKIYLKTSTNIRRVEGIAKSPVFSHLHATLQGLTTVRAVGAQQVLQDEFDRHQDLHTAALFMFIASSAAFSFSLEVLVATFIAIVTFSFLLLSGSLGAQAGLAITQAMALSNMMQWGFRQSAEVANNMTSVERVLEYSVLEAEPGVDSPPAKRAPAGWPSRGVLRMDNVWLRYAPRAEPALRGLSLTVHAAEKVGVVGRSGAGKSSLVAALFRLAYSQEGLIHVDEEDTSLLVLNDLRSHISIIPQDPVLFSGTLRRNLDPFDEFPDSALHTALHEVELKDATQAPVTLEARVEAGGANFSVGQRQLVCLARAILRANRILVLDEATANVDPHTDSLIQSTIREKFTDCTVLTVAHRLNTIIDCDRVLVMHAGQMVEFDHPHLLLQNNSGHFFSLVQETGSLMSDELAQTAKLCYQRKMSTK